MHKWRVVRECLLRRWRLPLKESAGLRWFVSWRRRLQREPLGGLTNQNAQIGTGNVFALCYHNRSSLMSRK